MRLRHVPGSPYTIALVNSEITPPSEQRADAFRSGDFHLYYDLLDVSGIHYEMVCLKPLFVSDDCDCNPGFVSHFD